jgi:hypothetical protein
MQCSGEILAFLTPTSYKADASVLIRAPFVRHRGKSRAVSREAEKHEQICDDAAYRVITKGLFCWLLLGIDKNLLF